MKWGRLFIGGHTELTRPVHRVDERLMRRIDEARRRLGEVHVKPVRSAAVRYQMRVMARDCAGVPKLRRLNRHSCELEPRFGGVSFCSLALLRFCHKIAEERS